MRNTDHAGAEVTADDDRNWRDGLMRSMGSIEATLKHFAEQFDAREGFAAKHRQEIRDKIECIEKTMNVVKRDVDEMKPEVQLVRGLRFKAGGAVVVLGAVGALIGWFFSAFADGIKTAIARTVN